MAPRGSVPGSLWLLVARFVAPRGSWSLVAIRRRIVNSTIRFRIVDSLDGLVYLHYVYYLHYLGTLFTLNTPKLNYANLI